MVRKPSGFWTKGQGLEIVTQYVLGKVSEDEAVAALDAACRAAGVTEKGIRGAFGSVEAALRADVRWYARGVRRSLGLLGLREHHGEVLRMRNYWLKIVGMGRHGTPIEDDWKRHRRPREGLLERAVMFPNKPKVKIGDGVVLYAAGHPRVIFAAGEFTSHPHLGPDSDYPWLVDVAWVEDATLPLVRYGVPLSDVGVDGKSVRQQSHIMLTEEQHRAAIRALRRAKARLSGQKAE